MKRLLGLTITVALATAAPAAAHTQLTASSPEAEGVLKEGPHRIELRFDAFETRFPDGAVRVLDENGAVVAASEKAPPGKRIRLPVPGVGEGSYVVAWKVLDERGEESTGAYSFHVGDAPQPPVVPPPPVVERTAEDELRDLAWVATIVSGAALLLAGGAYLLRRRRPEAVTARYAGQSALACAVLAGAGLLAVGPTEETRAVEAPGEHVAKLSNGGIAKVNITPPRAGSPRVELDVTTGAGQPDFALNTAKLRFVQEGGEIGPITFELPKRRPGYFEPELLTIPFPGRWKVELSLQRGNLSAENVTFTQEIAR